MPVDGDVPWDCAPHTGAKHDIYQRYLERWFPILLAGANAYPSVTYAEGFSGPGVYKGGEPGSPVIAMRALVAKVPKAKGVARFAFIDDDQRCVDMLLKTLKKEFPERPRTDAAMPVKVVHGTCATHLEATLDEMRAWGQPIFANLDSWGNAPVPYRLLRRLAGNVSSEVIVTLYPQHFVRFVSKHGEASDAVFGGDPTWRTVVDLAPEAKRRHILTCYRQALRAAGFPYLLDFELIPRTGQPLYLIFGTGHPLGVQKMKDSLWEVDRAQGVGFRDPRDEQAETLFDVNQPVLGPLTRLLTQRLRGSGPVRVEDLREFALLETVYRPEHVIKALKPLMDQGVLSIQGRGALWRSSVVSLVEASSV
ncbi:three-Cys-motif partner protein TcmP [Solwaraspora sp. WMMA2065]|uniref:three-Cys-motif partner protein TcmP n=1 Tax=Solwaraspora sp. WMMA2065 TaxID=3015166 RepID=UPI00259B35C6|nr:three-Cys-motif partner protein TcmP [Solwaraspora sp. WMMA2065]WJK34216.1 three-Cys-motif partner protein TcmP [Solwaraspora sp. WMMA2065]